MDCERLAKTLDTNHHCCARVNCQYTCVLTNPYINGDPHDPFHAQSKAPVPRSCLIAMDLPAGMRLQRTSSRKLQVAPSACWRFWRGDCSLSRQARLLWYGQPDAITNLQNCRCSRQQRGTSTSCPYSIEPCIALQSCLSCKQLGF